MQFYTYVWLVFKRNEWIPIYVGKGKGHRCLTHLADPKSRVGAHLRKYPHTYMKFNMGCEKEAIDLEMALIAEFGRKNLGKGPLFNLTDGGEGMSGYKTTEETRAKLSAIFKDRKRPYMSFLLSGRKQPNISRALKNVPKSEQHKAALSVAKSKPCTVDGVVIYPSRKALRKALGQGKEGLKHPNFRYINADDTSPLQPSFV